MRGLLALLALAGCAELGVISDGTSLSVGRPSAGRLIDGVRLANHGEGFTTPEIWRQRGNRYGTDELLDLITAVGRRMALRSGGPRLAVADLSANGGAGAARKWHRSHQSGRDVDLVFYVRDADGKPVEATTMRRFDRDGKARDGSGYTVDVPRMWALVKDLVTASEARVQWVFIYEPIAQHILEHALAQGEPDELIARARLALRQPGDSAPHDDHVHVRVYCSARDRAFGCRDVGPMEMWLEREAEAEREGGYPAIVAALVESATRAGTPGATELHTARASRPTTIAAASVPSRRTRRSEAEAASSSRDLTPLGRLLRMPMRPWR